MQIGEVLVMLYKRQANLPGCLVWEKKTMRTAEPNSVSQAFQARYSSVVEERVPCSVLWEMINYLTYTVTKKINLPHSSYTIALTQMQEKYQKVCLEYHFRIQCRNKSSSIHSAQHPGSRELPLGCHRV